MDMDGLCGHGAAEEAEEAEEHDDDAAVARRLHRALNPRPARRGGPGPRPPARARGPAAAAAAEPGGAEKAKLSDFKLFDYRGKAVAAPEEEDYVYDYDVKKTRANEWLPSSEGRAWEEAGRILGEAGPSGLGSARRRLAVDSFEPDHHPFLVHRLMAGPGRRTSRFRGVSKKIGGKGSKPWQARIHVTENGKRRFIQISTFAREEDAGRAFDRVSIAKLGPAKAKTNFPAAEYSAEWAELEALGLDGAVALERELAAAGRLKHRPDLLKKALRLRGVGKMKRELTMRAEAEEEACAKRKRAELATRAEAEAEARAERKRAEAERRRLALQQARLDPSWRDWAGGLPVEVLAKVAKSLVATETRGHGPTLLAITCEGWRTGFDIAKAQARGSWRDWAGGMPADVLAKVGQTLKHDGRGLFVFAGVCTGWRDVQRRLGGPLRARVHSDVILPGRVALVKWALAHAGCPREKKNGDTLARAAALSGHLELVQWLCGEGGFKMDERVMSGAARGGNLELVQWLRGEGCPWDHWTCYHAAWNGHLEVLRWARESGCRMEKWTCFAAARSGRQGVLRWARENGAPWDAHTEDLARERFGYTDNFGNLVL